MPRIVLLKTTLSGLFRDIAKEPPQKCTTCHSISSTKWMCHVALTSYRVGDRIEMPQTDPQQAQERDEPGGLFATIMTDPTVKYTVAEKVEKGASGRKGYART